MRTKAKTCSRCGRCGKRERRPSQRWCRECHAAHQRLTRRTYAELTRDQRMKLRCRVTLRRAVAAGRVAKPEHCSSARCRETRIESHHADYGAPLVVAWYCRRHHLAIHSTGVRS
jgi:hypothetical protein